MGPPHAESFFSINCCCCRCLLSVPAVWRSHTAGTFLPDATRTTSVRLKSFPRRFRLGAVHLAMQFDLLLQFPLPEYHLVVACMSFSDLSPPDDATHSTRCASAPLHGLPECCRRAACPPMPAAPLCQGECTRLLGRELSHRHCGQPGCEPSVATPQQQTPLRAAGNGTHLLGQPSLVPHSRAFWAHLCGIRSRHTERDSETPSRWESMNHVATHVCRGRFRWFLGLISDLRALWERRNREPC